MDNTLLAVRNINHKYIVIAGFCAEESRNHISGRRRQTVRGHRLTGYYGYASCHFASGVFMPEERVQELSG